MSDNWWSASQLALDATIPRLCRQRLHKFARNKVSEPSRSISTLFGTVTGVLNLRRITWISCISDIRTAKEQDICDDWEAFAWKTGRRICSWRCAHSFTTVIAGWTTRGLASLAQVPRYCSWQEAHTQASRLCFVGIELRPDWESCLRASVARVLEDDTPEIHRINEWIPWRFVSDCWHMLRIGTHQRIMAAHWPTPEQTSARDQEKHEAAERSWKQPIQRNRPVFLWNQIGLAIICGKIRLWIDLANLGRVSSRESN